MRTWGARTDRLAARRGRWVRTSRSVLVAVGLVAVAFVKQYVAEKLGRTLEKLEYELRTRFS